MRENSLKAGFKILVATGCLILYCLIVVYPYWEKNASIRTALGIWKGTREQTVYAILFYPAFWWYLRTVACHILYVRYIRLLIYPVCYLTVFAGIHGVLLIRDFPIVAGITALTVPAGVIGLAFVLFFGLKQDIKARFISERKQQQDIIFDRQLFDVVVYIVLPCLLAGFAVYSVNADLPAEQETVTESREKETIPDRTENRGETAPVEKKTKKESRGFSFSNGCDYFTGVMREASKKVEIGAEDSLEQIAKAYETEFKKEDVYGKIELHDVKPDYAEFRLWQKGVVWLIFRFEKKGVCSPDSENCSFSLLYGKDPCTQYAVAKTKQP